jgi:ATPase subunit of ABC transporter with duplicated ATPase domains
MTESTTLVKSHWNRDAISVEGLSIAIGSTQIVSSVSFTIPKGARIALLGRNGCGKTTLARWISSMESESKWWKIYQVAQELPKTEHTVVSTVLSAHTVLGQLWARQAQLESVAEMTDAEMEEYSEIGDKLTAMKSDMEESRARRILHGLGFSREQTDAPLSHLSGGWCARVALAQGLFMEPDLLVLDEPTNHLDLHGVIWLQEYLNHWTKTLFVISHNAGFLRDFATTQWYLHCGKLTVYNCQYDQFRKMRAVEDAKAEAEWEQVKKQVAFLKKKNRGKEANELLARKAAEGVVRPDKPYTPRFFILEDEDDETSVRVRHGALLATSDAVIGYSKTAPVLTNVSFALHPGCRVALVGANGSGKTTLIRFLLGELQSFSGPLSVSRRSGLRVCAFDQQFFHTLPEHQTPLEFISSVAPDIHKDLVRKLLGATRLEGAAHSQPIGTLSGGQKSRVYFASIAAQAPDILLMDEPTNHLDMETIVGLQEGLKDFSGAAVIVSHDLDFLEEIATEVWCTADGKLTRFGEGVDGLERYVQQVLHDVTDET